MSGGGATLASISDYKPYHILSYGTFLGATFFQSFIAGPVAFKALPRPMFSRLQQATFPTFFTLQTILPLIMLFTYPGERQIAVADGLRAHVGASGSMADSNFTHVFLPIAAMLVTSVANLVVVGPLTTKIMKQRHHQETRDGKKSSDPGPHSPEMTDLNKQFGILHGVSSLTNLVGFAAAIYYSFILGGRM